MTSPSSIEMYDNKAAYRYRHKILQDKVGWREEANAVTEIVDGYLDCGCESIDVLSEEKSFCNTNTIHCIGAMYCFHAKFDMHL